VNVKHFLLLRTLAKALQNIRVSCCPQVYCRTFLRSETFLLRSSITCRLPTFTLILEELIAENFSRDIDRINGNIRAISHSTDRVGEMNNQVGISTANELREITNLISVRLVSLI
jgi:hypothetical protein